MKRFASLNMNGADFRGHDLSGARFESCNLNGADFTGATLRGTLFASCNLNRAIFPSSALVNAEFQSCNMGGVRYVGTMFHPDPVVAAPPKPEPKGWRDRPSQGAARPQGQAATAPEQGARGG